MGGTSQRAQTVKGAQQRASTAEEALNNQDENPTLRVNPSALPQPALCWLQVARVWRRDQHSLPDFDPV